MATNPAYNKELTSKILQGIRDAVRSLVEKSAASNKSLVVGDDHGNIKITPAKDLLASLNETTDK